jgi:thiol-disulfide isomerase/thioredoxin
MRRSIIGRLAALAFVATLTTNVGPLSSGLVAQEAKEEAKEEVKEDAKEKAEAPEDIYAVADDADVPELLSVIKTVKSNKPRNLEQFLKGVETMEKASGLILAQVKDKKDPAYDVAFTTSLLASVFRLQVGQGAEVDVKAVFERAKEYLGTRDQFTMEQAEIAATLPSNLENVDLKLAVEAYDVFSAMMRKQKDPRFSEYGEQMAGSGRRLGLAGNSMEIVGTTFAGDKFDLKSLKGKVVLVDFWATWCGPCLQEVPNMLENYEKYHDKGFEIVGVSIDKEREDLEGFMAERKLPWIILHENGARNDPNAMHYGVNAIPFMVLIGRDGKVISMEARGPELTEHLNRLFAEK